MQEQAGDAGAEDEELDEAASEASQDPVNELYDEQGVLMCQLEAFIDLRFMLPGVQPLAQMSQLMQHVAHAQHLAWIGQPFMHVPMA